VPTTAQVIDQLNTYTGDNPWQDIILKLDLDETATDEIDEGGNDRFVLADGSIIRWDPQTSRWHNPAQ